MDLEKLPGYFVAIAFFYAVSLFAALFYFIAPSFSAGFFAEPDLWIYTILYLTPLALLYFYMKRKDNSSAFRIAAAALMAVDIIIAVVLIFPLALF